MIWTIVKNNLEGRTVSWVYDPDSNQFGKWFDAGEEQEVLGGYPLPVQLMGEHLVQQMTNEIQMKAVDVKYTTHNQTAVVKGLEKPAEALPDPEPVKDVKEAENAGKELKKDLTNRTNISDDEEVSEHDRKASKLREDMGKGFVEGSLEDIAYDPKPIMKDPSDDARINDLTKKPEVFDVGKYREGLIDKQGNPVINPDMKMRKTELQKLASRFHIAYSSTDTKRTLVNRLRKKLDME
jgi:hypothetical protein